MSFDFSLLYFILMYVKYLYCRLDWKRRTKRNCNASTIHKVTLIPPNNKVENAEAQLHSLTHCFYSRCLLRRLLLVILFFAHQLSISHSFLISTSFKKGNKKVTMGLGRNVFMAGMGLCLAENQRVKSLVI